MDEAVFVLLRHGADVKPSDHTPQIRNIINDQLGTRWSDSEILGYFNDCLGVMVDLRPDLFGSTATHTCATGAEQTLNQVRQIRVNGVLSGPSGAVTPMNKADLDQFNPAWTMGAPGSARNWAPHEADPLKFYLSPPSNSGQLVVVAFTQAHAKLASLNDTINLPDNYGPAIQAFVINRANMKDDEAVNTGRGNAFMQDFMGMIGAIKSGPGA